MTKTIEENKIYRHTYYLNHKQQFKEYQKKAWLLHREEKSKWAHDYKQARKELLLRHYGNGELKCVNCGFDNIKALSLDHINGGGNKHRRDTDNKGGEKFYTWLIKNNFPEGYQTLCMNCQFIKRYEVTH